MPIQSSIVARDRKHLDALVANALKTIGPHADLNHIDVSNITDMSELFLNTKFNGNISEWNVSNVMTMARMFEDCRFNGDISRWDTGRVQSMRRMFRHGFMSEFEGDVSQWNVSNVCDMSEMFSGGCYSGNLNPWDVSSVTDMSGMFMDNWGQAQISHWNVARVTTMENMFHRSTFAGDISRWNVSGVTKMKNMFAGTKYQGDLSRWLVHPNLDFAWVVNADMLADTSIPNVFFWYSLTCDKSCGTALDAQPAWKSHWENMWPLLKDLDLNAQDAARLLQESWLRGTSLALELPLPEMDLLA